jgi:predicted transcriptional regulator
MRILWARGPSTINELIGELDRKVAYTTVLTLVRILEQKGYVAHQPHPEGGKAFVYRAAVAQRGVRTRHVRDLVDRLFGGRVDDQLAGLVADEHLGADELKALRAQIDDKLRKGSRR